MPFITKINVEVEYLVYLLGNGQFGCVLSKTGQIGWKSQKLYFSVYNFQNPLFKLV